MSKIDYQALRETADAANKASWGRWESYHPHKGARGHEVKVGVKAIAQHCLKVDAEFIAASNPATVLALLDELEAAEKRIAELERKEQHSERQSVIDALAGSGEEWSDIEEYMQKWDAERASAAGKGE